MSDEAKNRLKAFQKNAAGVETALMLAEHHIGKDAVAELRNVKMSRTAAKVVADIIGTLALNLHVAVASGPAGNAKDQAAIEGAMAAQKGGTAAA